MYTEHTSERDIVGTGTVDGDGLMYHGMHETFLCARSVVLLVGDRGKYVPRTKQAFLQASQEIVGQWAPPQLTP